MKSPSSVLYGIQKFFYFCFLQGVIRGLKIFEHSTFFVHVFSNFCLYLAQLNCLIEFVWLKNLMKFSKVKLFKNGTKYAFLVHVVKICQT